MKNTIQMKPVTAAIVTTLATGSTGLFISASAATLDLADQALEIVTGVEPNIFILTDDSGSMDYEVLMNIFDEGRFFLPNNSTADEARYHYLFPAASDGGEHTYDTSSNNGRTLPSEESVLDEFSLTSDGHGVWRARYHGTNAVYYNPNITYIPWKGVKDDGVTTYTSVSPAAAPYDPYLSSGSAATIDLTSDLPDYTAQSVPDPSGVSSDEDITVSGYYPARYYTWTDTNTNDIVDADDAHTRVEIKPAASGGSDSYTRDVYNESTNEGRSDCGADGDGDGLVTCTYAQEIQNFANWFSYYRQREYASKASLSLVIEEANYARMGFATINDTSNTRIAVASMNISPASGNKKSLLDKIFDAYPQSAGTPLRGPLDQLGKYFDCASGDLFGSSGSSSPGSSGCPVEAAPAGSCQQNYGILVTDGYYNQSWSGSTDHDASTDSDFDGGAFADGRTGTLADIAMDYYEHDLHGTLTDDVPATTRDASLYRGTGTLETMHQHMTLYTVAFGVNGTLTANPSDKDTAFTWPDPSTNNAHKIDDLRHAAYNGRGLFLSASNPIALYNSMDEIFDEISASTGAASAVAFNTQNLESESKVFRAFFNTTTNTGDLIAQNVNLDGSIDSAVAWSAAEQLDSRATGSADSRIIITYNDTGDGSSSGVPFAWSSLTSGAGSQQEALDTPTPTNYTRPGDIGEDRLEYLRGQTQYEGPNYDDGDFRDRPVTEGKLGDMVHSAPVFVGKPPFTGRNSGAYPSGTESVLYSTFKTNNASRSETVYIGANDGMLHAFNANDGSERFAYIPNILMSDLRELTDPNYNHRFYVDLTPSLGDVYMTRNSTTAWHTVLMGGLGAGGKGYYALDVTDPDSFDTESNAAANVMWEFTEADDGGIGSSDLGYTFGRPLIAMSNADSGNGYNDWIAVFGNGYNSTSADGDAYLYVLRLEGGEDGVWTQNVDFVKLGTGNGKAESADGTTPNGISGIRGVDINLDGTVDYVYAGDLQGNLYRFDLSDSDPTNWSGDTELLFQARYGTSFPRTTVQPITNRPIVVKHPSETGFIVITGTGSWMTNNDASSTDIQSIYGIWDDMSGSPQVSMLDADNHLIEQTFENKSSTEHGFTVRTLSSNAVDWKNNGSDSGKVKGWYIDLDVPVAGGATVEFPGERAIRDFRMRGGILFVNTVIPKSTASCTTGPGGFSLGFDPVTGGTITTQVFDINGDGGFDLQDNVDDTAGDDKIVAGTRYDNATPSDSSFIGDVMATQLSDKTVDTIKTNTSGGDASGRISWRELKP